MKSSQRLVRLFVYLNLHSAWSVEAFCLQTSECNDGWVKHTNSLLIGVDIISQPVLKRPIRGVSVILSRSSTGPTTTASHVSPTASSFIVCSFRCSEGISTGGRRWSCSWPVEESSSWQTSSRSSTPSLQPASPPSTHRTPNYCKILSCVQAASNQTDLQHTKSVHNNHNFSPVREPDLIPLRYILKLKTCLEKWSC